jgi:ABC-type transport system involved in cytochrome bd biosynthesis fused ATPase/permease subunit
LISRISIARIIVKNPTILILDEFNAHLDVYNESLIKQSLQEFVKDGTKTVIAISHKFQND